MNKHNPFYLDGLQPKPKFKPGTPVTLQLTLQCSEEQLNYIRSRNTYLWRVCRVVFPDVAGELTDELIELAISTLESDKTIAIRSDEEKIEKIPFDEFLDIITAQPVLFWLCPEHREGRVEWNNGVATCLECERTNNTDNIKKKWFIYHMENISCRMARIAALLELGGDASQLDYSLMRLQQETDKIITLWGIENG